MPLFLLLILLPTLFLILALLSISYIMKKNKEHFTSSPPQIHFLTREEAIRFHQRYTPSMVQQMTPQDIHARLPLSSPRNKDTYYQHILENVDTFTPEEQSIIRQRIQQADQWFTQPSIRAHLKTKYIDVDAMRTIPWRLMKMGLAYESGYPHTREEDVISLSPRFFESHKTPTQQVQTMIHERIHIYQKRYPHDMQSYFHTQQIWPITISETPTTISKYDGRYNSDLDGRLYYRKPDQLYYKSTYRSDQPTSVQDVYYPLGDQRHEHPLEEMAYDIEALFRP